MNACIWIYMNIGIHYCEKYLQNKCLYFKCKHLNFIHEIFEVACLFVVCWWVCASSTDHLPHLTVTQSCQGSILFADCPFQKVWCTSAARAVTWTVSQIHLILVPFYAVSHVSVIERHLPAHRLGCWTTGCSLVWLTWKTVFLLSKSTLVFCLQWCLLQEVFYLFPPWTSDHLTKLTNFCCAKFTLAEQLLLSQVASCTEKLFQSWCTRNHINCMWYMCIVYVVYI